MNVFKQFFLIVALIAFVVQPVHALSRPIGRDIEFPEEYPAEKAKAILSVVQNQDYEFVDGIVSYWPPDWSTRLSFTGNAESLNIFLSDLRELRGIGLRVILYQGENTELRRDSAWQLDFSHARPDQLTVYLNLNSKHIDWGKVMLPEWESKRE